MTSELISWWETADYRKALHESTCLGSTEMFLCLSAPGSCTSKLLIDEEIHTLNNHKRLEKKEEACMVDNVLLPRITNQIPDKCHSLHKVPEEHILMTVPKVIEMPVKKKDGRHSLSSHSFTTSETTNNSTDAKEKREEHSENLFRHDELHMVEEALEHVAKIRQRLQHKKHPGKAVHSIDLSQKKSSDSKACYMYQRENNTRSKRNTAFNNMLSDIDAEESSQPQLVQALRKAMDIPQKESEKHFPYHKVWKLSKEMHKKSSSKRNNTGGTSTRKQARDNKTSRPSSSEIAGIRLYRQAIERQQRLRDIAARGL